MKKMWFLLVLTLSLYIPTALATKLTENQCIEYGLTAANMSIVIESGATLRDILGMLDNPDFQNLPTDIQLLVKATAKFLTTKGKGNSPEDNFQGATDFCIAGEGDVAKMVNILEATMGTSI